MEDLKTIYSDWTLINWDGNKSLGFKCYRKTYGGGYVSVGVGEFTSIVYSYGATSENSMGSTRWRETGNISEIEAMKLVDLKKGKCC